MPLLSRSSAQKFNKATKYILYFYIENASYWRCHNGNKNQFAEVSLKGSKLPERLFHDYLPAHHRAIDKGL